MQDVVAPVEVSMRVPKGPKAAFRDFIYEMRRWWPLAQTYFQDDFAAVTIEPMGGGWWYEVDKSGQRVIWGEVREFDPPNRVLLSYAVDRDHRPEPSGRASEVEMRFEPLHGINSREQPATRITITHRHLERHEEGASAMRELLASPQGWPLILSSFARLYSA